MANKKYHERDWSDDDIEYLHKHKDRDDVFFAKKLKRSLNAVSEKRYQVGANIPKNIHWTPENLAELRAQVDRGNTDAEIAALWGSTKEAINATRRRLLGIKYRAGRRAL